MPIHSTVIISINSELYGSGNSFPPWGLLPISVHLSRFQQIKQLEKYKDITYECDEPKGM